MKFFQEPSFDFKKVLKSTVFARQPSYKSYYEKNDIDSFLEMVNIFNQKYSDKSPAKKK